MRDSLRVAAVTFRPASRSDQRDGLRGWASADIGNVHVDGLVVRATAAGKIRVFPPEHRDNDGRLHVIVRPRGRHAARVIERQILDALDEQGVLR